MTVRTGWPIVRDSEADALYIYISPPTRTESATPTVARTRQVTSSPAEVLADFDADHRLVGIEILRPGRLRPLYLYRRHRRPDSRP